MPQRRGSDHQQAPAAEGAPAAVRAARAPAALRAARAPAALRAAAALAALALAAAACSSGGSSTPSTPAPAPSTPAASSAPAAPGSTTPQSGAPGATGAAPADTAAATAEVTRNWERFFDPATPLGEKAKYLERGARFAPVIQGFAGNPTSGQVKANVTKVEFTSPTTATVTYTLTVMGNVVLPDAKGKAVLENGTWKVSDATLCALVTQGSSGAAIPGCG